MWEVIKLGAISIGCAAAALGVYSHARDFEGRANRVLEKHEQYQKKKKLLDDLMKS